MKLDVSGWKQFKIEDLFTIVRGKTLTAEDKEIYSGNIPCINGGSENNGYLCGLNELIGQEGKAVKIVAPALSLSRVGNSGLTLLQTKDFYIADNAFALAFKESHSILCYLFVSTILNMEQFKYSYGRTIALNKYWKTIIKLPSTEAGNPDWNFMESYMKSLHHKPLTTNNKPENTLKLEPEKWKSFKVGDLFECDTTTAILPDDMVEGDIPYVTRSAEYNGCSGKLGNIERVVPGNCITIGAEGATAFYQPKAFIPGVKVYTFRHSALNKFSALFLVTLLNRELYKYSYGRARILSKVMDENIMLPVTKDDDPDWQFMEDYIKSLPYGDRI